MHCSSFSIEVRELYGWSYDVCLSFCVSKVSLPLQGSPEGWRLSDVSSNVLSLPGMGWLCFPAI